MNKLKENEFLKIYEDFSDAIFRHCYFRVFNRELAKDLTQEVFIKIWEYVVKGGEIENPKAFLYKTANNLIIDNSRKNSKKELSLEELRESGQMINDPVYRDSFQERLEAKDMLKILDKLDSSDKEIVVMRYIDELTPKEIAEISDLSENAVSVRIHRAIKKIRNLINDDSENYE